MVINIAAGPDGCQIIFTLIAVIGMFGNIYKGKITAATIVKLAIAGFNEIIGAAGYFIQGAFG